MTTGMQPAYIASTKRGDQPRSGPRQHQIPPFSPPKGKTDQQCQRAAYRRSYRSIYLCSHGTSFCQIELLAKALRDITCDVFRRLTTPREDIPVFAC